MRADRVRTGMSGVIRAALPTRPQASLSPDRSGGRVREERGTDLSKPGGRA